MRKPTFIHILLWPLSGPYGFIMWLRNRMFDHGLLKQKAYPVPVIVVGNLSAGGTGKTPQIIYLAEKLKDKYSLAILSRGYKRKSSGFRWVKADDDPLLSGDEPLEIKNHLPDIAIATDGNRRRGLSRMLKELKPSPDLILLDDGFQHRWVKPTFSLVLTRAEKLYTRDSLLPSGRLRESIREIKRAEAVCITGCNQNTKFKEYENEIIESGAKNVYFSEITYQTLALSPESHLLLVTSIAHPGALLKHLQKNFSKVTHLSFHDHHRYTNDDIRKILSTFDCIKSADKSIVTTRKDWVKLKQFTKLEPYQLSCIDINISILLEGEKILIDQIQNYVEQNSRKS
ncbi:MAG: tetraacyldisaccharide 4'-kinase [Bacteroidales bacterium]|nr:tetraacyldisaccharide 4'-kinase [Bacteroidales bacterium]